MERDPRIQQLIKEAGVSEAPGGFTGKVMQRIGLQADRKVYKPLIGRTGKIVIFLFLAGMVLAALLLSDTGETLIGNAIQIDLSAWNWQDLIPDLKFLQELNPWSWLTPTVVALFLLVLSDAGFRRFS